MSAPIYGRTAAPARIEWRNREQPEPRKPAESSIPLSRAQLGATDNDSARPRGLALDAPDDDFTDSTQPCRQPRTTWRESACHRIIRDLIKKVSRVFEAKIAGGFAAIAVTTFVFLVAFAYANPKLRVLVNSAHMRRHRARKSLIRADEAANGARRVGRWENERIRVCCARIRGKKQKKNLL